jgi:hypothetical protein
MAKKRDPIGPLMDLNVGGHPHVRLQRLANAMRAARVPLAALAEATEVDEGTGVVTRMMALCGHCAGSCCRGRLRIQITHSDAARLAKNLGTTVRKLPLLAADGTEDEPEDLAGYLSKGQAPCPFFDKGCTVHGFRPDVCRTFGLHACIGAGTFAARTPGRDADADANGPVK